MADDALEERIEQAEAHWQEITQGNPSDCEWGFFSYGGASPAIGGGVGMFVWFPDRTSMLAFIETTLPYYPAGPSRLDPDEIAGNTAAVIEKLRLGILSDLDGIKPLNEALATCSQLTWIGTVVDLLEGDHPYLVEARLAFRDDDDKEKDAEGGSIEADEKEDSFEFLNT